MGKGCSREDPHVLNLFNGTEVLLQSSGTAVQSIAAKVITEIQERYGGTAEYSVQNGIAMRSLAIIYAGRSSM